ncbi:uncharacterized protein LOC112512303 [Cynara cardunculus var. scolymus]|uniref:uncharacterized protein LOC112512303 n=1 Tax=Cynara cardunculus var. scolymus TaxID=59895 RepID=UPI000D62FE00|nr:uncharacterized protein LOC112512303 [Cynara cardunculus var. scolymus]
MKVKYQGNARVKRGQLQRLRRSFKVLEMKGGESVTDYFGRVLVIANDMRNYGEDMDEVKVVENILRTLIEKFNFIVCSIEESKEIDQLTVDELQSLLLVHEQKLRKREIGEEQVVKVTTVSNRGKGGRGYYQGRGRDIGGRGRATFDKSIIKCFRCHKLGHFQYECLSWGR